MDAEYHPLLRVLEGLVVKSAPHPLWREGESLGVGLAMPLGAQWLIATHVDSRIEVHIGGSAPVAARASVIMEGTTASALLERDAELGDVHIFGDRAFLSTVLGSSLSATNSHVGLRVTEMTRDR